VSAGEAISDPQALVSRMLTPIANRDWYVRTEATTPHAAMGVIAHTPNEGVAQEGDVSLAVSGPVYDLAEDGGGPGASARALLARYKDQGVEGLHDLNGQFAIAVWDEARLGLHVVTDRVGSTRLYYWQHGNTLYVATHQKSFLWHPDLDTTVSEQSLAEYMVLGCCLEDRALIGSVRSVPGATEIRFDGTGLSKKKYWNFSFCDGKIRQSHEDYAEELVGILRRCIRRAANGRKPLVGLTGGFDSRITAAIAAEEFGPENVDTFTMGSGESWDVAFARQTARYLGVAHTTVPIPPSYYADFSVEGVRRTEAAFIGHTCYRIATDELLRDHPDAVVLNGYAGDFYHIYNSDDEEEQSMKMDNYFEQRLRSQAFMVVMGEELLPELLRPAVFDATKGLVRDSLQRSLDATSEDHIRPRTDNFEFDTVFPRRYARMNHDYWDEWRPARFPFCDMENMEFAMNLPLEIRLDKKIPLHILRHIFPKAGRAPHTETGKPISGGPMWHSLHSAWGWLQFKALPKATFGKAGWRNRKAYVHYLHWLRTASRTHVEDLFREEHYLESYFNMDYVRSILRDVLDGRSGDFGRIYNLAHFIQFQKHYCDNRGSSLPMPTGNTTTPHQGAS
jgi:hypothetical protein